MDGSQIFAGPCMMVSQNHFTLLPNHNLLTLVPAAVVLHPNSFALKSQVSLPLPPLLRIKYISKSKQHGSTAVSVP